MFLLFPKRKIILEERKIIGYFSNTIAGSKIVG
jgi:hypothetical protein